MREPHIRQRLGAVAWTNPSAWTILLPFTFYEIVLSCLLQFLAKCHYCPIYLRIVSESLDQDKCTEGSRKLPTEKEGSIYCLKAFDNLKNIFC